MLREIDNFYLSKEEPAKSCLLAMRKIILASDSKMTEAWKYSMPFFCYKGRMFCYLWVYQKTNHPYMGIVDGNKLDHPKLISEKRSRMKVMVIEPTKDLPIRTIHAILKQARSIRSK